MAMWDWMHDHPVITLTVYFAFLFWLHGWVR